LIFLLYVNNLENYRGTGKVQKASVSCLWECLCLALASNKWPRSRSLAPSHYWVGEENGKEKSNNMWVRIRAVNRTANKANSSNSDIDKENI